MPCVLKKHDLFGGESFDSGATVFKLHLGLPPFNDQRGAGDRREKVQESGGIKSMGVPASVQGIPTPRPLAIGHLAGDFAGEVRGGHIRDRGCVPFEALGRNLQVGHGEVPRRGPPMLQKGLGLVDAFVGGIRGPEPLDEHEAPDLFGSAGSEQDGDAPPHRMTDQVDRFLLAHKPGIEVGDVVPEVVEASYGYVFRFAVPPVVRGLDPAVQTARNLSPCGCLIEEPMQDHGQPTAFLSPMADMELEPILPDWKHLLPQRTGHGSKR